MPVHAQRKVDRRIPLNLLHHSVHGPDPLRGILEVCETVEITFESHLARPVFEATCKWAPLSVRVGSGFISVGRRTFRGGFSKMRVEIQARRAR